MKKISSIFILIIAICALCATQAAAQPKPKVPKIKAPKMPAITGPQTTISTTNITRATNRARQTLQPVPTVVTQPTNRLGQFVTEYRRPLIGIQKFFGLTTRKSWENLQKLGAVHIPPTPRPRLTEDAAFTTQNLTELSVPRTEREAAALHPFQNQRGLIYRGLALNSDEAFRNILENGLLIKDAGSESNTLMLAISGGMGRPSTAACKKITNLTDKSTDAVMWAGKRMGRNDINAVVVVKSQEKGDVIITTEDIPAEDIYAVTALLRVNGKPTWCKVELEGDGFRITPYQEDISTVEVEAAALEENASHATPPQEDVPFAE